MRGVLKKLILSMGLLWSSYAVASSMTFTEYTPCDGNGSMCAPYILAQGTISETTPDDFMKFLETNKGIGTLYFDSEGGNVLAALQLGMLIRQHNMDTFLGAQDYTHVIKVFEDYKVVGENPKCLSACAYAFLGGVNRKVEDGATYGVHQFYTEKGLSEAYTQTLVSRLSIYIKTMGANALLIDIASNKNAKEIEVLSKKEINALNIDNTSPPLSAWSLKALDDGTLFLTAMQIQEENKGMALVNIFKMNKELYLNYIYMPLSTTRPLSEVDAVFQGVANMVLVVGDKKFNLVSSTKWAKTKDGYNISFPLKAEYFKGNFNGIEIQSDFPNAMRDVDPSIELGVQDFASGFKAIIKN